MTILDRKRVIDRPYSFLCHRKLKDMEKTTVEQLIIDCYTAAKLANLSYKLTIYFSNEGKFVVSLFEIYENECLARALTSLKEKLGERAKRAIEKDMNALKENIEDMSRTLDYKNKRLQQYEKELRDL